MRSEQRYFKIGVFILGACAILVAGILVLGAGSLFERKSRAETYVSESIQGLDVGAPVKYLGVKVGELEVTDFVASRYNVKDGRIRLVLAFRQQPGQRVVTGTPAERVRQLVDMGMRIRLASAGLTGGVYLELDLLNPKENPAPEISWKPENPYLPSVPSTGVKVTSQVEAILDHLGKIRFEEISDKMVALLANVDTLAKKLDPLLTEIKPLVTDADGLIQDTHRLIIDDLGKDLRALVTSMKDLLEKEVTPTVKSVRAATDRLPETLEKLDATLDRMTATLRRVDRTVASEAGPMGETLDNLRVATGDLRELMNELRKYPSQALFGEAPPKKPEAK
jgi:phospholipid/cholesterol/gamma-HCH transport system substrate-binding protein/paraquat-inducible protein B